MCIMAPVSPIGLDGTSAHYQASDLNDGEPYQLPGIRIEPITKKLIMINILTNASYKSPILAL
jgi:hypothetical protein